MTTPKNNLTNIATVNVLASGSKGNCTAVNFGKVTILLDAGIGFDRIQRALNFENPLAALITHEHGDHAKQTTIAELLKRGVNVYMSAGTAQALQLEPRHNLFTVKPNIATMILEPPEVSVQDKTYWQKQIAVYAHSAKHDAAEPLNFEIFPAHVGYFIDTNALPVQIKSTPPAYLLIECNHDVDLLLNADIDQQQKHRILQNHFSLQKVVDYITCITETPYIMWLKEIHLLHISKRHGNAEQFKQIVQNIVGDKVKVFAY